MKMTLEEYMKLEYDVIVTPEECTDGTLCYRAEHPQLPGCMSHGQTPEEAIRNLIEAKRLYIETLLERGLDVPLPLRPTGMTFSSYRSITTIISPVIKVLIIERT
ncbi:MAG: type II toxin-antitoxin system HicB family antitoxin [Nitrospirota bacterium]